MKTKIILPKISLAMVTKNYWIAWPDAVFSPHILGAFTFPPLTPRSAISRLKIRKEKIKHWGVSTVQRWAFKNRTRNSLQQKVLHQGPGPVPVPLTQTAHLSPPMGRCHNQLVAATILSHFYALPTPLLAFFNTFRCTEMIIQVQINKHLFKIYF